MAFGPFVLDTEAGRLTRASGKPVALPPKAYAVLCHLAARPGRLVTKGELLDAVWGHRHVTESVLKTVMSGLRQALDDDARAPRWIETAARRGYRFVGAVDAATPASAAAGPQAGGAAARPRLGNLPSDAAGLVGRRQELERLLSGVARPGLITVVGPGGVGKTRLALHAAEASRARWPDGAWLVELAPVDDACALRGLVAQTLALPPAVVATDEALAEALSSLRALVVIDNAEQVADALATLLQRVRIGHAGPGLLVTSQVPLAIEGEVIFPLGPLALSQRDAESDDEDGGALCDAEQLFVQRVARRLPDFCVTPGLRAPLRAICRCLDGLPLALELAAASVPLLGVHGLCERLTQGSSHAESTAASLPARLDLPAAGWRTALPRHRSLREAMAWSHALLSPPQRLLFRRLAVLRSSFTASVAERVASDGRDLSRAQALQALAGLVDLSLVVVLPDGRLRLFEAPREFALEQLDAAGERDRVLARLVEAMLECCAQWDVDHADRSLDEVSRATRLELDHLRTALRALRDDPAGAAEPLVRLLLGCFRVLFNDGLADEACRWIDLAQARLVPQSSAEAHHGLMLLRAYFALHAHSFPMSDCITGLHAAADHFAATGERRRESLARYLLWMMAHAGTAGIDMAAAWRRMHELDDPRWSVVARRRLRMVQQLALRDSGQTAAYVRACRDEHQRLLEAGARTESVTAGQALMLGLLDAGEADEALHVGLASVAEARALGRQRAHPALLALTLMVQARYDDPALACAALERDAAALRASGRCWMAGNAMAWIAARDGRDDDAARLLGWVEAQEQARAAPAGPAGRRLRDELRRRLVATLGAARCAALGDEGRALADDDAALACALRRGR
jgi:predicted ATPase/DNA-binding winged helix-turn-helix (wHTH) protein